MPGKLISTEEEYICNCIVTGQILTVDEMLLELIQVFPIHAVKLKIVPTKSVINSSDQQHKLGCTIY